MLRREDWERAIAPFLLEGEAIQWMGQPNPRRVFTPADLLVVPFVCVWLYFYAHVFTSFGFTGNRFNDPFDAISLVTGGLVALVGAYWLLGRFIVEYFTRRNTLYVVTDQRLLVRTGFVTDNVEAINLHAIAAVFHNNTSLWFRTSPQAATLEEFTDAPTPSSLFVNPKRLETLAFLDIADANALYALVETLHRAPLAPTPAVVSHVPPDPALAYVIEPLCDAGETVLWAGQPERTKLFTDADWLLIPVALLVSACVLMPMINRIMHGAGVSFVDIPLLLISGDWLIGRFVRKYWRKRHIFYAVTDRHIIVLTTSGRPAVLRYPLATIPLVAERLFRDGTGTLRFGSLPMRADAYRDTGLDLYAKRFQFREGQLVFASDNFPPTFSRVPDAHPLALLINVLVARAHVAKNTETVE